MVEEEIDGKMMLNQPAGHLEHGENLIEAVIRETQEETAYLFKPTALVGIYRWIAQSNDTYIRFCFTGKAVDHFAEQALDPDIHKAIWLSVDEVRERKAMLRSPLVLNCLEDYVAGRRYPLNVLVN